MSLDQRPPRVPVAHARFEGREGLLQFPRRSEVDVVDPDSFEAQVSTAQFGAVTIRRTRMSGHRTVVDGRIEPETAGMLRLMTVQAGAMTAESEHQGTIELCTGDALFAWRDREYRYRTGEPLVVVASIVPTEDLPTAVRDLDSLPFDRLDRTPLVDAFVGLMANLSRRLDEPMGFDAAYVGRGFIDLEAAVLSEALASPEDPAGRSRVLAAARAHIEAHLHDPELAPPSIAGAIGVSLRTLHAAFDGTGTTVARYVKERRLAHVADTLQDTSGVLTAKDLAQRFGFRSPELLTRTFKQRFGVRLSEARDALRS